MVKNSVASPARIPTSQIVVLLMTWPTLFAARTGNPAAAACHGGG